MLREGSHAACRRWRPFGFDVIQRQVGCVRACRGRPTRSCRSGAACGFMSQSPLQPGWAALLVSGRVFPWLRSLAVGGRGAGEPFAADNGAGRWSARTSAHPCASIAFPLTGRKPWPREQSSASWSGEPDQRRALRGCACQTLPTAHLRAHLGWQRIKAPPDSRTRTSGRSA